MLPEALLGVELGLDCELLLDGIELLELGDWDEELPDEEPDPLELDDELGSDDDELLLEDGLLLSGRPDCDEARPVGLSPIVESPPPASICGQFLSLKPEACATRCFSALMINPLSPVFGVSASIGTEISLSPVPMKPPTESTAYAILPDWVSITMSFTLPTSSLLVFCTCMPMILLALLMSVTSFFACSSETFSS